jgi:hypothetical protein
MNNEGRPDNDSRRFRGRDDEFPQSEFTQTRLESFPHAVAASGRTCSPSNGRCGRVAPFCPFTVLEKLLRASLCQNANTWTCLCKEAGSNIAGPIVPEPSQICLCSRTRSTADVNIRLGHVPCMVIAVGMLLSGMSSWASGVNQGPHRICKTIFSATDISRGNSSRSSVVSQVKRSLVFHRATAPCGQLRA